MEQVAVHQMSRPFPLRTKFSWALNAEEQDVQPVAQADPYFIVMEGKIVILHESIKIQSRNRKIKYYSSYKY